MAKISSTLEIRLPTREIDKVWLQGFALTLRRQYEEVARAINSDLGFKPSFSASSGTARVFTTSATFIFETEHHDQESSYNTSNGVFTCPTNGIYFFAAEFSAAPSVAGSVWEIIILSTPRTVIRRFVVNSTLQFTFSVSAFISLSSGDTVEVQVNRVSGTGTLTSIADTRFSEFFGLLYAIT